MPSKYNDPAAVVQVIGCVYNDPSILDIEDKYTITEDDFQDKFHQIVFGSIFKLHELGAQEITLKNISDFLADRPKSEAIYKQNKGDEWLAKIAKNATPLTFDYYYGRLKKFSLLRAYDNFGVDVSDVYDIDNILDVKKKQIQEEFLDNSSLEKIADTIDGKLESIRIKYVAGENGMCHQAGEGIDDLLESLKKSPDAGVPLYGPLINTVTRGARLRKLYIRSAATGTGKTRSMIADFCYIGTEWFYDETFGWIRTPIAQPSLFIATEQDLNEVQTMMLAFISNVNEEHILRGLYVDDEWERVERAAQIIKDSPLYIEEIPDFSLQDIENIIKKNIRENDVTYIFFDYIQSSMKILEEITRRSGGVKLREDNILFMLSAKLKDLCNKYGVFIMTATQLNGSFKDEKVPDQNLLRGAKSIADRVDYGSILLNVTDEDLVSLNEILSTGIFATPNIKLSIYKNRRGRYKGIYLWCNADLGTCRIKPMFATTYSYELVPMDDIKINVEEQPSAF